MAYKLLYVADVAALFRSLADEPDTEYLPWGEVSYYLHLGYERFRDFICELDPHLLSTRATQVVGADYIDLAANFFQATEDGVRIKQLVGVYESDTADTSKVIRRLEAAADFETLRNSDKSLYLLEGTILRFDREVTRVTLEYVPESTVDWSQVDPTAGGYAAEYIDHLVPHHDLIALFALDYYKAKDGRDLPEASGLTKLRQRDLQLWTIRRTGAHRVTQNVNHYDEEF